jgi:hypothetical protein
LYCLTNSFVFLHNDNNIAICITIQTRALIFNILHFPLCIHIPFIVRLHIVYIFTQTFYDVYKKTSLSVICFFFCNIRKFKLPFPFYRQDRRKNIFTRSIQQSSIHSIQMIWINIYQKGRPSVQTSDLLIHQDVVSAHSCSQALIR